VLLLTQGYLPYVHRDGAAPPPVAANPPGAIAPSADTNAPRTLAVEAPAAAPTTAASAAAANPVAGVAPIGTAPTPSFEPVPLGPPGPVPAPSGLLLPVAGVKVSQLVDTYTQSRGTGRLHDAIDIMAARGTPVLAVADGRVVKLFTSVRGGLTLYQFDTEEKLEYYYAHLDAYAPGIVEGKMLKRGELLGFVGSTGDASPDAPHLHFSISVLGPEKNWWQSTPVNPYPLLGGQ
jgi:murein DD-endopeptidase MepM/ murein hydrolase activator NlpD